MRAERIAIKMLDKTKLDGKTQKLLFREIGIMEHLNHPNIVRIYEVVETINKLNIVLEYCAGTRPHRHSPRPRAHKVRALYSYGYTHSSGCSQPATSIRRSPTRANSASATRDRSPRRSSPPSSIWCVSTSTITSHSRTLSHTFKSSRSNL